jgi:hypothetical protein
MDALKYYTKINNNSTKLFCRDISRSGQKEFIVSTPNYIYKRMKEESISHYYEFWTEHSNMFFSLDLDMKVNADYYYKQDIIDIINKVISGAKEYYDYTYSISDIIVLQNDEDMQRIENPNKISFHIVFKGLVFENHLMCKDFFLRLNKQYNMKHCDKAIYNLTCLRLCFNSKMGRHAILKPVIYTINNEETYGLNEVSNSEDDIKNFWNKTLITYIDKKNKLIDKSYVKTCPSILQPKVHVGGDKSIDNINIESSIFQLPSIYYDDYHKWSTMGMILCSISDDCNDFFDMWDKWSQQSEKYRCGETVTMWKSFLLKNPSKKTVGLGTLIKWCRDEGIVNIYKNEKKNSEVIVNEYPVREIVISDKYLKNAQELNQAKLEPSIFKPHLNEKLLAIQSEKGTGKTYNLLDALFKSGKITEKSSVLFVSSRRTFGIKLLSDLKKYDFKLYSDIKEPYITSKRIICQIDSLLRLEREKYDYVIVDECESLARYLSSSHFVKNPKANLIVSSLDMRVSDADHVYIMDADLSDRCLNYYSKVMDLKETQFKLIINKYQPYANYEIEYMSYGNWLTTIIKHIEDGKKSVIPMASNNKAKDLYKKLQQDFSNKNILLIHKETSDDDKVKNVLDIDNEWIKYDVVIYTPSVCMGVSFDKPNHFDNIYAYGCFNSLGSQEFCQMLHRVRNPKSNKIYLSMDQYKEHSEDDIVEYNIVEKMLCSDYYLTSLNLHNNLVPKKITKIVTSRIYGLDDGLDNGLDNGLEISPKENTIHKDKMLTYPYKDEPIYDLYIRNSWEIIEDTTNFSSKFFGYAKFKGYQLKISPNDNTDFNTILQEMKDIKAEREDSDSEEIINGIYDAPLISKEEYSNKIKFRDEHLEKTDVYAIKKYNIVKCYTLDKELEKINEGPEEVKKEINEIMTKDFIEKFADKQKMSWFRNLVTILNTEVQTTQKKLEILMDNKEYTNLLNNNCYLDFTTINKYAHHFYPIKIIELFDLDINQIDKPISHAKLEMGFVDCLPFCEKYKQNIVKTYGLLNYLKRDLTKLDEKDTSKLTERLKFINLILYSQYGVKIKKNTHHIEPENRMYKLDYSKTWNETHDDINDESKIICNYVNPWKKSINLRINRDEYDNSFDSSYLDEDLFLDEIESN